MWNKSQFRKISVGIQPYSPLLFQCCDSINVNGLICYELKQMLDPYI